MKYLIVNADDFGLSNEVNAGIIEAHERGIVTSTSVMVRWPSVRQAARYLQGSPGLDAGLHVDLGEWKYEDGEWLPVYSVVPLGDRPGVEAEVRRQLEEFCSLVGRSPSHIDSHQHVHLREPMGSVLRQIAGELGVPLRHCSLHIRYCGEFYGQTTEGEPLHDQIQSEFLTRLLDRIGEGVTELACHPGRGVRAGTTYTVERDMEVDALCDPLVLTALRKNDFSLCSFAKLPVQ